MAGCAAEAARIGLAPGAGGQAGIAATDIWEGDVPVIHHGTPMTPRAALMDVCAGRAMCVSFWRPDDVEAVEAISPAIMFRQRRVFGMAGGAEARRGMVHTRGLDPLFRLARAATISPRKMGRDARCSGRTLTTQRFITGGLAVWTEGRAALAYGRAGRSAVKAMRQVRPGMPGLDRQRQASGLPGISFAHGGSLPRDRQSMASASHDARCGRGTRLPLRQCRQHQPCSERMEA